MVCHKKNCQVCYVRVGLSQSPTEPTTFTQTSPSMFKPAVPTPDQTDFILADYEIVNESLFAVFTDGENFSVQELKGSTPDQEQGSRELPKKLPVDMFGVDASVEMIADRVNEIIDYLSQPTSGQGEA